MFKIKKCRIGKQTFSTTENKIAAGEAWDIIIFALQGRTERDERNDMIDCYFQASSG
jgi:hypothetical protein